MRDRNRTNTPISTPFVAWNLVAGGLTIVCVVAPVTGVAGMIAKPSVTSPPPRYYRCRSCWRRRSMRHSWLRRMEKRRLKIRRKGLELLKKGVEMCEEGWIRHVGKKKIYGSSDY